MQFKVGQAWSIRDIAEPEARAVIGRIEAAAEMDGQVVFHCTIFNAATVERPTRRRLSTKAIPNGPKHWVARSMCRSRRRSMTPCRPRATDAPFRAASSGRWRALSPVAANAQLADFPFAASPLLDGQAGPRDTYFMRAGSARPR